jgi:hypothetical protein
MATAQAAPVPPPAAAPAAKPWMVSPAFDLTFFIATSLAVLVPWIAVTRYQVQPVAVLTAVAIASNGPHLVSTWTRIYFDGNERWKRPVVYWVVPIAITIAVTVMTLRGGSSLHALRTILFYWAVWHFAQQNWGILRIYQRKAGEAELPIATLERVILWLGALWPMSIRLDVGPMRVFGSPVAHPEVTPALSNALAAALVVAALAYAAIRIRQIVRGQRIDIMRPLFLGASCLAFYVPFVLIKNGTAAFATAALWHGLQYVAIVWFFNRNRWKAGVDPKARVVSWISQPGRTWLYAAFLLAVAGVTYGLLVIGSKLALDMETWSTFVWTSLTFSHYWVDGFIWKLRKPELRANLVTSS